MSPATAALRPDVASPVFVVPAELSATEPPEARALARDEVRLLVAEPHGMHHALFRDLGRFLSPGDLIVVNTSATVPSAADAIRRDHGHVTVHFSSAADDDSWIVELRLPDGSGPVRDAVAGERLRLSGGARLTLIEAFPDAARRRSSRLWRARATEPIDAFLARWGRPITYGYVRGAWPIEAYQTVFAREDGSAEMPSASRPFSDRLVTELVSNGILFAPVLLHAGVSSLEAGEAPQAERFRVTEATARLINHVASRRGRIVAAGTTAARAVETVAYANGTVGVAEGWTDLVLGPRRPARVVNGLITGWHTSDAPHLGLLEAIAGADLVREAYAAALEARYLWHEFGDSCLFLPRG